MNVGDLKAKLKDIPDRCPISIDVDRLLCVQLHIGAGVTQGTGPAADDLGRGVGSSVIAINVNG